MYINVKKCQCSSRPNLRMAETSPILIYKAVSVKIHSANIATLSRLSTIDGNVIDILKTYK